LHSLDRPYADFFHCLGSDFSSMEFFHANGYST
jgi:hypothetical protein